MKHELKGQVQGLKPQAATNIKKKIYFPLESGSVYVGCHI